ncbi:EF-hand domain-containing protein [Halomonas korlensis]|uniref:EF hand n=1 Tax=Halomonas korlensis TaxID=463301 RepID=A0A1I7IXX3_9GAMM|nr:EF-hand domain-containing protein [Halomonas korlensis]SFU77722.1 EF hand [Halomonas korlensis]
MVIHRLAIVALLGSLLVPGFVWADGEPFKQHRMEQARAESVASQGRGQFEYLDTDGNGRISADEVTQRVLPEPFRVMDRNHDGYLTPHEFRARSI